MGARLEHVPDGLGELESHLDAGDFGATLAAETTLGPLVVLGVDRMAGGVDGGCQPAASWWLTPPALSPGGAVGWIRTVGPYLFGAMMSGGV